MQRRAVYLGIVALLLWAVWGSGSLFTAQATGGDRAMRAAALQTDATPTPAVMPGMDMPAAGSTLTGTMSGMDHSMAGMDTSQVVTDTLAEEVGAADEMADDIPGMVEGGSEAAEMDMVGHGMGPVSSEGALPATELVGGQPLAYMLDGETKVFTLTAQAVQWPLMQGVTMTAYTYNGVVPGPLLRVTAGDKVRVVLQNELPEATSIHWHGVLVPNSMDGVSGVTQDPVEPGATFTYEFVAKPAGSFMYHSHTDSDKQVGLGLYAPFIIDPMETESPAPDVDVVMMLSEARIVDGQTYESMPMAGAEPNYFLINGKAFPATETIQIKKGDRVRVRFMGIGQFVHPMHLHGLPFKIVATDGYPVPEAAQLTKDTVLVSPGERYDIEFVAEETGKWVVHCHILHHTTNDGVEPGGLMMMFDVVESQ